jgi:addiction module HigA family antidote
LKVSDVMKNHVMKNHPHPGAMLRETVFEPLKLTISDGAERLAMSRVALSRVLNGKAGISPDLAIRLEQAGVSSARFWMGLQSNYELSVAVRRKQPKVRLIQDVENQAAE